MLLCRCYTYNMLFLWCWWWYQWQRPSSCLARGHPSMKEIFLLCRSLPTGQVLHRFPFPFLFFFSYQFLWEIFLYFEVRNALQKFCRCFVQLDGSADIILSVFMEGGELCVLLLCHLGTPLATILQVQGSTWARIKSTLCFLSLWTNFLWVPVCPSDVLTVRAQEWVTSGLLMIWWTTGWTNTGVALLLSDLLGQILYLIDASVCEHSNTGHQV